MAEKATNTLFVTDEEKALAEEANLKSLQVRANVQEIAEDSKGEDGSFDKEKFAKSLKRRYKKVNPDAFDKLVDHVAGKYS